MTQSRAGGPSYRGGRLSRLACNLLVQPGGTKCDETARAITLIMALAD